mmetsp:Transcript_1311/g.4498  ORF Transcript_1311/g.4498 Transcript_1311/m.4498 type:complete len:283 (+) Transcript_1311:245-1093(+)
MLRATCSSDPRISPALPIFFTTCSNCFWHLSSICTSTGWRPEPLAMRSCRSGVICTLPSSSAAVQLSIITRNTLSRSLLSLPMAPATLAMPGSMPMTLLSGPSFMTFSNCSYMSRSVNLPLPSFSSCSAVFSVSMVLFTSSQKPLTSPMPSMRDTNDRALKGSRSSKCSPVPRKMMGDAVAATALSAPPPLAWPSSLVTTTLPTGTASRKEEAWSNTAWPWVASMTKTMLSGSTASRMSCISSNSAASWRWRPDVSTMITSNFSSRNWRTPSSAMCTGSASV